MKYVIAAILIIGGFGGSLFLGMGMAMSETEEMQRFVVPGGLELELSAGDYTIYYETSSIVDGVGIQNNTPSQVSCNVMGANGNDGIGLQATTVKSTYTIGSYTGESLFALSIPADDFYYIECNKEGEPAAIAIGQSGSMALMFILLGVLCLFAGIVFFILGIVETLRNR